MIKNFNIPSYEEWKNSDYVFEQKIGDYYCCFRLYGKENCGGFEESLYGAILSMSSNPMNFLQNNICFRIFRWNGLYEYLLKEWFEDTSKVVKHEFEKYIKDNYLY